MRAGGRLDGVPGRVLANVEVEIAVAVEIGEDGRRGPAAIASQARFLGQIFECAVATIVVEGVGVPASHEQVRLTVVVEIADGHAMPVASGEAVKSRPHGHVFEMSLAEIAK